MPQMIQYIDAIARQRQRDVLYLVFGARTVREYMHEASVNRTVKLSQMTE